MRAFNQSNNSTSSSTYHGQRSKSSCSYCGDVDHQVTSCPHVKSDWAHFQSFTIPCSDADNWTNNPKQPVQGQRHWSSQKTTARWFKDPSGWSKWYAQCEKAYGKVIRAEEKAKAKVARGKTKRAKSCGFCGGIGHTRRDCPEMTALNKRLIRANNHWRQRLFEYFVEELGLGVGALIKVSQDTGGWQNRTKKQSVGIVTSINWDELNMFCYTNNNASRYGNRVHQNLQAPLEIKVQVNDQTKPLTWSVQGQNRTAVIHDTHGRPLVDNMPDSWRGIEFVSVVSPTETPLSQDWLTQGQAECVEFITKKYSYDKLEQWKAIETLENYEKRYNLK